MPDRPAPLPIRDTLRGRRILLTGGSGFFGQVWLAMLLSRLPEIGRVHLLLRAKKGTPARARFEDLINHSPVFAPLHDQHGAELSETIGERVEVLEGDTSKPGLGLPATTVARLRAELDLIVHCAGLIDFNPDLRRALEHNVEGTLNVAALARGCDHAALLHVSTCYVAGGRQGLVREQLTPTEAPNGARFDPAAEKAWLDAAIAGANAELTGETARAEIEARLAAGMKKRNVPPEATLIVDGLRQNYERRWLKERCRSLGIERAASWGFRNTYTYSKFLAEGLLLEAAGETPLAIFRPSIIESALSFPFPGWNQGLNASAPIVHLGGTWFRFFPSRRALVFDTIPVDLCCNALTTVAAALLRGEHAPVYQIGTSTRNPLTMDRMVDLTMLAHRRHLRRTETDFLNRQVKSRWDPVVVEPDHFFRMENLAKGADGLGRLLARLPKELPDPVRGVRERVQAAAQNSGFVFGKIDKILKTFGPFIYDDHYVFESTAIDAHTPVEPEFDFATERIDWRDYWLQVHVPGLRKWVWPTIEGREIEPNQPKHRFALPETVASLHPTADDDRRPRPRA